MGIHHSRRWTRRDFIVLPTAGCVGLALTPLHGNPVQPDGDLLWRGGPFDRPAPSAPRELLEAVRNGDTTSVREILQANPLLKTARDAQGRSIFVLAHMERHPETAAAIQEFDLELDLVEAILANDEPRVEQLVASQPESINAHHPIGGTAYFTVGLCGRRSMVFRLDRWGGDPNVNRLSEQGMTAARAALECVDRIAGEETAIRILANSGDVNAVQKNGDSILHAAARRGSGHLIRLIVRRGGDVNARNRDGQTPLEAALQAGNAEAAEILRNHRQVRRAYSSSRLDYRGGSGSAGIRPDPLVVNEFAAVCHFNFERVKELVQQHPEVVHYNAGWNEMGVEASAHMGRHDMVEYLLERGAPMSLPTSLMMGDSERCRSLLEADPERIRERGPHDFALMWYPQIAGGRVDMAELLINYGADVNEEKLGVTGLHRAAYSGQLDLVAYLLEQGADRNQIGKSDFSDLEGTPLDFAAANGQSKTVELLKAWKGSSQSK